MKNSFLVNEKSALLFDSFQKAVKRLQEMAVRPKEEATRDATIQRFEFSFELAWKLLNAILREKKIEAFGPKDTIRVAAEITLLADSPRWMRFLEARNLVAHTYNEEISEEVYEEAKEFITAAENLIRALKEKVFK